MAIVDFVQSNSNFLIWILSGFCGWIWWSFKRRFATKEDVKAVSVRVDRIEQKVADMPGLKDFHKMQMTIEHMAGVQNEQKAILQRVEKILDRQQDYLMSKDK